MAFGGIVFIIFWLASLALTIYLVVLATRFVVAVETIAARMRR